MMARPRMSVIVITPDNYETVRRLIGRLHAQTVRQELEIVIVAPPGAIMEPHDPRLKEFAALRAVEIENMASTALARAAGIRAATADIVVLTEDHSLPEAGWAEALIRAHEDGWAAAGPAVGNGNPRSLVSWANLLIEYSEWIDPAEGGEARHLPGHNSSYKRDLLLTYGDELGRWLEAESVLHWDLRGRGHRLWLESSAKTQHLNFSRLGCSIGLRFHAGRLFAGMRRSGWGPARRLAYAAGSPLIPFVRLFRIVRELRRPGRQWRLLPRLLPFAPLLLAVDAAGEMTGYLFGPGGSSAEIARVDFHRENFMNRSDRRQFASGEI